MIKIIFLVKQKVVKAGWQLNALNAIQHIIEQKMGILVTAMLDFMTTVPQKSVKFAIILGKKKKKKKIILQLIFIFF